MTLQEKVLSNIEFDTNGGCWFWTASLSHGYGRLRHHGRAHRAHRVSYLAFRGALAATDLLLHQCDIPCCVNPHHLRIGTQRQNLEEMSARGRRNDPRGTRNPNAKLDDDKVRAIRALVVAGDFHHDIAARFNISDSRVSRIANRHEWKHVE